MTSSITFTVVTCLRPCLPGISAVSLPSHLHTVLWGSRYLSAGCTMLGVKLQLFERRTAMHFWFTRLWPVTSESKRTLLACLCFYVSVYEGFIDDDFLCEEVLSVAEYFWATCSDPSYVCHNVHLLSPAQNRTLHSWNAAVALMLTFTLCTYKQCHHQT